METINENGILTEEIQKICIDTLKTRLEMFNYKKQSKQVEIVAFITGFCLAIDQTTGKEKACMPSGWFYSIMRGDFENKYLK